MNIQLRPRDHVAQFDIEANRQYTTIPPLPAVWRSNIDSRYGAGRPAVNGETEILQPTLDNIEAKCRGFVGFTKMGVQAISSLLWSFAHLGTEFWHPSEFHPPQRLRLHLWYACFFLLNRPSKYLGYFYSFFDSNRQPPQSAGLIDRTRIDFHKPGGASVYRRNISGTGTFLADSPGGFRPIPAITADWEQELVKRWNTEVMAKIANDRDRYWRLNIAILLSSIASMQTPFISQSPLLMGNLFLIFAFSGLGCFSGWNRDLLEEMRTMQSIKQWEPLLLPSFDPAVVGNEFEFLALPEIYAVKAVLFTFVLVLLAPFSYYGYPVEFGGNPKVAFIVIWCIILVWGAMSVVFGTIRMRAYGVKSEEP